MDDNDDINLLEKIREAKKRYDDDKMNCQFTNVIDFEAERKKWALEKIFEAAEEVVPDILNED